MVDGQNLLTNGRILTLPPQGFTAAKKLLSIAASLPVVLSHHLPLVEVVSRHQQLDQSGLRTPPFLFKESASTPTKDPSVFGAC